MAPDLGTWLITQADVEQICASLSPTAHEDEEEEETPTSPQAPHWDGLPTDRCGMYKNFAQKQINGFFLQTIYIQIMKSVAHVNFEILRLR